MDNFDFFSPNFPKNEFWGRNFKNLSPDAEWASPRYHVCQFSSKTDNFNFFSPNLPKKEFWGQKFKILSPESESAPLRFANFQVKRTTLTSSAQLFWPKFAQKWILRSKFWKSKSRCRISSSKIPCMSIFRQNGELWLFRPKFAQKWILGSEFWKTKSGCRINSSKIPCVPISKQNG